MGKINALTYNISFATQINKAIGSEKDFVEACQYKYKNGGKQCNTNAIKHISKIKKIDVIGLQEVNSEIEKKIIKIQPNLKKYKRVSIPVETKKGNIIGFSNISIIWNPSVFGKLIKSYHFNLGTKTDPRPCMILYLKQNNNDYILINLHAENHMGNYKIVKKILEQKISKSIINGPIEIKKVILKKNIKIINLGDFNDKLITISKYRPIKLDIKNKLVKLSQQKDKNYIFNNLISCCWHKKNHKFGHFTRPSDYILVNDNLIINKIYIPKIFNYIQRDKTLFSDHKPVFAEILYN